jgi:hypothetical protein
MRRCDVPTKVTRAAALSGKRCRRNWVTHASTLARWKAA